MMSDHMDTRVDETIFLENGPLLNFWMAPIGLPHPHMGRRQTLIYKGNEWCFQARKTTCLVGPVSPQERIRLHGEIATAPTAFDAKRLGRSLDIKTLKWDECSYRVMLEINRAKFTQHRDLCDDLMRTGVAKLVEHRPDPIWGDGHGTGINGKNLQGRILMRIRAELRKVELDQDQWDTIRGLGESLEIADPPREIVRMAEEAFIVIGVQNPAARRVLEVAKILP